MTTQNLKPFKLTKFVPVGFKQINYKIDMCLLCRGKLTEVCQKCQEMRCENCPVTKKDDVDYHTHCMSFLDGFPKSKPGTETKPKPPPLPAREPENVENDNMDPEDPEDPPATEQPAEDDDNEEITSEDDDNEE